MFKFGAMDVREETPVRARERLHGSVAYWIARAQEANDAHDPDAALDALRHATEAARSLRHHLTGVSV
jgi:hypothetical protein